MCGEARADSSGGSVMSVSNGGFLRCRRRESKLTLFMSAPRASLGRGTAWTSLATISNGISRFLANLLVGRLSGPTVLGIVSSANSMALLAVTFFPLSNGSAASRFVARAKGRDDEDELQAIITHTGRRAVQSSIILAAIAMPFWLVYFHGTASEGFVLSLLILGYGLGAYVRGVYYGTGQIGLIAGWDIGASMGAVAGIAILAASGARGISLLLPVAVAQAALVLFRWPSATLGVAPKSLRKEIDFFTMVAVMGSLASSGMMQLALIVCRVHGGDTAAGMYGAALAVATPLALFTNSLSQTLHPAMAESFGKGDVFAFWRQTDSMTRVMVTYLGLLLGVTAIMGRTIIESLWGQDFIAAGPLMSTLVAALFIKGVAMPSVNSLSGSTTRGLIVALIASQTGLLVAVIMWLIPVSRADPQWIANGYLLGVLVTSFLCIGWVWRVGRMRWTWVAVRACLGILVMSGASASLFSDLRGMRALAACCLFAFVWIAVNPMVFLRPRRRPKSGQRFLPGRRP